ERKEYPFKNVSLIELSPITFEKVDTSKFKAIDLAKWAGFMGGVYVPVLVGADEEAVSLFLERKISFLDIADLIEETLSEVNIQDPQNVEEILEAVEWGRKKVRELYEKKFANKI
ncbi:MAG TPA: 1-deoxy-D-xylulose-5-phosphate reductoisomerase, partial [Aquifex aeolicus]|nr:1-deoxy-D-xylulose-5-phosphate reductoisomerase [Aquifex aeolicus]